MIILDESTPLYHGSYCEVKNPDLDKCKKGKDFGRGFYLTSSKDQAVSFVRSSIVKASSAGIIEDSQDYGYVTEFKLRYIGNLRIHIYQDADSEWLHCIAAHRRNDAFKELIEELNGYDVVGGKIADDLTNMTLVTYINGAFGLLGSEEADRICIGRLLPERLKDQFCFRTELSLQHLEFAGSEKIWLNK